ncbi:hypothetical protein ACJRPK_16235 [Aquimarina sp. 2-A2]|uniref:hypothetical protein n=1 Tax=Aquimarina sp. 2-A2 TaxID=3382644 RepID=UPI00387F30D8
MNIKTTIDSVVIKTEVFLSKREKQQPLPILDLKYCDQQHVADYYCTKSGMFI